MDTGKPSKTCVEVVGRRTFRTLPSRQQSGYNQKSKVCREDACRESRAVYMGVTDITVKLVPCSHLCLASGGTLRAVLCVV